MKQILMVALAMTLAACGGGGVKRFEREQARVVRVPSASSPGSVTATTVMVPVRKPMASGPISQACNSSDRKARSRELCGCIQAVADQSLSRHDQVRAAGFYKDPHAAQEIRQSDRPGHEAFWKSYVNYAEQAKRICA